MRDVQLLCLDVVRSTPGVVRLHAPVLQAIGARARRETDPGARAVSLSGGPGAYALEVRVVVSLGAGPLAVVQALERALLAVLGDGASVRVHVVDVAA